MRTIGQSAVNSVIIAVVIAVVAAGAAHADPFDKPAFTATPAELLAAARAVPAGDHDVVILREDLTVTYDERGRGESRTRLVFAIVAPSAVDDWGTIGLGWRPFYQHQPVIRARVIGAAGDVAEFDPALIHDAPAVNESPSVFSDRRRLTAPLPRLAVGAVVEEEFVTSDREPLLAAGIVSWFSIARSVPVARKVVTISSPTKLGARVVVRGPAPAIKPIIRKAGARTIVTYDLTGVAAAPDGHPGVPSDFLTSSWVGVGTGASWSAIANGYLALVEERLARPVDLPSDVRGPTPRATVDRLLAWLHARVRYTGIELSDSAIIPFAPAETLARGFGDCKDKATVLVALLRAAGIEANLALLSTGPGWDTDPALPGMGSFDHAIVRAIVDGKDLWIDATEDQLLAGQLPVRDQARQALIVAASTRALTLTPQGAPADNLIRERRTFALSEHGAGRVVEVSEQTGVWSSDLRGWIGSTARKDVQQSLARYVTNEYQAKLVGFTHGAAHDLSIPFTLTVEAEEVGRTGAMRDFLYVWLFPSDTLERLPDSFTSTSADFEELVTERTVDYVWTLPHSYEIANRLDLPPGYSAPDLPARETRSLGAMTLTTTRARTPGALTITYRLDTGKLRLTADELRATRAAVKQLNAEDGQRIVLNLDAASLKGQGKMREAIAEYRRLIALHPKEALHHGQLAQAYLAAGLGEAARREARLATTLEPKDGDAWMVLGYVLDRDLVGRQWRPGSDSAGAEAAFRRALALSPTHVGAKDDLAALLATDGDGHPTQDVARLREAATLLRSLERDGGEGDDRLIAVLARAGDAAGLAELAQGLPDSRRRQVALVTATALRDGGEAALRQVDGVTTAGERAALISGVIGQLMVARRYDAVRALRRPTLASAPAQQRAMLERLRAVNVDGLAAADPLTPVLLAHSRWALGPRRDPPWSADTEAELAAGVADMANVMRAQSTVSAAAFVDFLAAGIDATIQGDASKGWRIKLGATAGSATFYVAMRKGRAFLLGGSTMPAGIGRELLDLVKRRDLAGARTLLGQFAEDRPAGSTHPRSTFLARHKADLATAPAALLEVAAAMLLAEHAPAVAAPILRGCGGLDGADDRADCQYVAAGAYVDTRQWALALDQQRAYVTGRPDDTEAALRLARLLTVAGKGAEAGPVLDAALAKHPDDDMLRVARAYAGISEGWSAARPRFDQLTAPADASSELLNNAAWAHLYFDPTPATARALIERVTAPAPHAINTLAAVLAESDEPYAAWQRLEPTMDAKPEVWPADWYVIGRIAEGYGLRDDAIAAYRRAITPDAPEWVPSQRDFARKRLKGLGVP